MRIHLSAHTNRTDISMIRQRDKACGADIHKKTIVATILSADGTKVEGEFGTIVSELIRFKEWLKENNCNLVAVESTSTFLAANLLSS